MSANIVLILRFILVLCLYGFFIFALIILWKELEKTSEAQKLLSTQKIIIEISGENKKEFFQPEIFIGRSTESDIQIMDETVSLNHARIFFHQNYWMLEDNDSTNGTFLNGEVIHSASVLVNQDHVKIGEKDLRILL